VPLDQLAVDLLIKLHAINQKKIILLDQAESPMYDLQFELNQQFPTLSFEVVIGDISNEERMYKLFDHFRPEIVFHAAAYNTYP
jgi:FlaA1/EpsC-like NDP-sugar epimerase